MSSSPLAIEYFKFNFGTEMKNEIILYRPDELAEHIEVRLEDETVWLSQQQMAALFEQTKQNISLHINNCFKENEFNSNSVVKESLTTAKDGKKYNTKYYNLDVIISVGYRVKSKHGTQFRIWATRVLKDYLLKEFLPMEILREKILKGQSCLTEQKLFQS